MDLSVNFGTTDESIQLEFGHDYYYIAVVPYENAVGTYRLSVAPYEGPSAERWAGENRYETAVEISRQTFGPEVEAVFIATGENFPDALAAGPVAGLLNAPILLVRPASMPSAVSDELVRLDPSLVIVLGGTQAVSHRVRNQVATAVPDAEIFRIAGQSRYETAAALSQATWPEGANVVYVATGTNYPDALVAGPMAARQDAPILLTKRNSLPAATRAELRRLAPRDTFVLGGQSSVSDNLTWEIQGFRSRVFGASRYDTAVRISRRAMEPTVDTVLLTTGQHYADATASGPAAFQLGAPVLLVRPTCAPQGVLNRIDELMPRRVVILGGENAVADDVLSRPC